MEKFMIFPFTPHIEYTTRPLTRDGFVYINQSRTGVSGMDEYTLYKPLMEHNQLNKYFYYECHFIHNGQIYCVGCPLSNTKLLRELTNAYKKRPNDMKMIQLFEVLGV